jgi:hypothetical protein
MAGLLAEASSLKNAILVICLIAWLLCFVVYLGALFFVPSDIRQLRAQLRQRSEAAGAPPSLTG